MWGHRYWPWYLYIGSITFLVPEIYALVTNVGNTLSDYAWYELNVTKAMSFSHETLAWWFSFIAWIVFMIGITIHIWFRAG